MTTAHEMFLEFFKGKEFTDIKTGDTYRIEEDPQNKEIPIIHNLTKGSYEHNIIGNLRFLRLKPSEFERAVGE